MAELNLNAQGRELVDDMLGEMAGKSWQERRALVCRIMDVALAATRFRAEARRGRPVAAAGGARDILGDVLAVVIAQWEEPELVSGDQAYIWALSADRLHQQAAFDWYTLRSAHGVLRFPKNRVLH